MSKRARLHFELDLTSPDSLEATALLEDAASVVRDLVSLNAAASSKPIGFEVQVEKRDNWSGHVSARGAIVTAELAVGHHTLEVARNWSSSRGSRFPVEACDTAVKCGNDAQYSRRFYTQSLPRLMKLSVRTESSRSQVVIQFTEAMHYLRVSEALRLRAASTGTNLAITPTSRWSSGPGPWGFSFQTPPLAAGQTYTLSVAETAESAEGTTLDGRYNGVPGQAFSRDFEAQPVFELVLLPTNP